MDFIREEIEEDILNRTESIETERDYEEREYSREYEERREIERERIEREKHLIEEECLREEVSGGTIMMRASMTDDGAEGALA